MGIITIQSLRVWSWELERRNLLIGIKLLVCVCSDRSIDRLIDRWMNGKIQRSKHGWRGFSPFVKGSVPKVDTSRIPTYVGIWQFKKTYMSTLANLDKERQQWSCYFENEIEYRMISWSGAHRYFLNDFLFDMYILDLNMYLYARNNWRS